ncbi:MAG: hypothetical protein JWM95_4286 [Gemmatimonadetes bacterium]|nr:hypothetical protein [Gemmatimonadota bacterium]
MLSAFSHHLLFVGVNNGISPELRLRAAESDAQHISDAFADLGYANATDDPMRMCATITGASATTAVITARLNAIRDIRKCDLLFVYWAGHLNPQDDRGFLVTGETSAFDHHDEQIALEQVVRAMLAADDVRYRVLMLDVCYGGRAISELAQRIVNDAGGDRIIDIVAASDAHSPAWQREHGPLAEVFLPELAGVVPDGEGKTSFSMLLGRVASAQAALGVTRVVLGAGDIIIPVRRKPQRGGHMDMGADPLEQSMGYAVQAFRDYLNRKVSGNVELIYFLSYDVWDGCLVYDGLVQGSIEQQLLEYVRRQFLDRDRLRSKYEELRARGDGASTGTPATLDGGVLGAAGECFRDALAATSQGPATDPVQHLRYLGNLRNYSSEYATYDHLLGLGSCLYIPVVGKFIPVPPSGSSAQDRVPLGGVLMAVNRSSYGLEPAQPDANAVWKRARESFQDVVGSAEARRADKDIGEGIARALAGSAAPGAGEGDNEVHHFLQCIGGVYAQRARRRSRLRRVIHPQFVKGAARALELTSVRKEREEMIRGLVQKIRDDRAQDGHGAAAAWAQQIRDNGIANLVDVRRKDEVLLGWDYLIPLIWRDLKLVERRLGIERDNNINESEALELAAIAAQRELRLPVPIPPAVLATPPSWDDFVRSRAIAPDIHAMDDPRRDMAAGDTISYHFRQIARLIDDLRDGRSSAVDALLRAIRTLAPVGEYLEGIGELEAGLASGKRREYLHQLAHTVQVWLLGVWILEPRASSGAREADHVALKMQSFLRGRLEGERQAGPPQQSLLAYLNAWIAPGEAGKTGTLSVAGDHATLFWGLVTAMHDLTEPVQHFDDWSRQFFLRYFRDWAARKDRSSPILLDVLHHTRYPFYKNAITGLYPAHKRNWLESVFYIELTRWVSHAVSGSLLLVYELEKHMMPPGKDMRPRATSYSDEPWRRAISFLRFVPTHDESAELPEQFLLMPAYLAHAIALSHLGEIVEHWNETYPKDVSGDPKYLTDVTDTFKIDYASFPLTFLLGLAEVLLDAPSTVADPKLDRSVPQPARSGPASVFFVNGVLHGVEGAPITITISVWLDDLGEESLTYDRDDISELFARYDAAPVDIQPGQGLRLEDLRTAQSAPQTFRSTGDYTTLRNTHWQQKGGPLHIAAPAYDIVRMMQHLKSFQTRYTCGKRFSIRFQNVATLDQSDKPLMEIVLA